MDQGEQNTWLELFKYIAPFPDMTFVLVGPPQVELDINDDLERAVIQDRVNNRFTMFFALTKQALEGRYSIIPAERQREVIHQGILNRTLQLLT